MATAWLNCVYHPLMAWIADLMRPLEVAATSAKMIKELASVAPSATRSRTSRERRSRVYLEFRSAAQDVIGYATLLKALSTAAKPTRDRVLRTVLSLSSALPLGLLGTAGLTRVLRAASPITLVAITADFVGDIQNRHAAYNAAEGLRRSTSIFLSNIVELRLTGRFGPQQHAENIVALVGELLGRIARPDEDFDECQAALGKETEKFVLSVRAELDRRSWHISRKARTWRWQIWRAPSMQVLDWRDPDPLTLIAAGNDRN
jgi:hypothetical protein